MLANCGTNQDEIANQMMIGAGVITFLALPVFVAYLKQHKKPEFKRHATICLVSSIVGISLSWAGPAICTCQDEPSLIGLKLMVLGNILTFCPLALFPMWFVHWLTSTFNLQPRKQCVLFKIGGLKIEICDIVRVIFILVCVSYLVHVLRL